MTKKNDFVYDAAIRLQEITGITLKVVTGLTGSDAVTKINDIDFITLAKAEVRNSSKGIVLSELNHLKNRVDKPVIVIAKYLAVDVTKEFKRLGINYLDIAGNAYINEYNFFVYTSGLKAPNISKTKQTRAFQEAGIKLIFHLLKRPDNLQCTYRKLAEMTDISIGSVSSVMKELEELNYVLVTNKKKVLKNIPSLVNRWIVAYNEILRPRIISKRMRFSKVADYNNWNNLPIQHADPVTLWGGEPAAAILTGQLQPEKFLIYTSDHWQGVAGNFKLIPDEQGDVEILFKFWKENDKYSEKCIVPALLIYADLVASGHERNIQVANEILKNELQYIK